MRKNVKSLSPILWMVIAAFIIAIFAVWGGAGRLGETRAANTIVSVGKVKISAKLYNTILRQRLEMMKRSFRGLDRRFIEQLNIPQQILQELIQQTLLFQLAQDFGLEASNEEIFEKIVNYSITQENGQSMLIFQKDGKFIGLKKYKKILVLNRMSTEEFEEGLRKEIILEKVVQLLTAGIPVTQEEIRENYKKENENVKLEYVLIEDDKIELEGDLAPDEIQSFFEKNREKYKIPEKREGEYVFFKTEDLKTEIELTELDIEKYYKDNSSQFEEPEKVKVSRIYLAYEYKEKGIVQAEAKIILEKIKKGEDFSELAKKHSRDEKARDGGDWGFYDWNKLSSKEKEQIEKLSPGEISSVLELEDGVSLLKVTEKNPVRVKPFEEVKDRIKSILVERKARALAEERIARLEKSARKERSLDVASQKNDLRIRNTGLMEKGDALEDIDPSGFISQALFNLKEKEITSSIYTYQGVGIAQLLKIELPRQANFEEVEDKAKEDVLKIKKKEKAREKMKEVKFQLHRMSMEQAAEKNELEYKTADKHKREQYLSVIGENAEIDKLAFSLPLNEVSEPVEFENGFALIQVLERKEVSPEEFEKNKEAEREKFLEEKKNKFFQSYISKLWEEKEIKEKIKYDLFLKITSDVLSKYGVE